jgi:hypothetical protein
LVPSSTAARLTHYQLNPFAADLQLDDANSLTETENKTLVSAVATFDAGYDTNPFGTSDGHEAEDEYVVANSALSEHEDWDDDSDNSDISL